MKGALKSIKRAPHLLTSKVGMATSWTCRPFFSLLCPTKHAMLTFVLFLAESSDAETDEIVRKFAGLEEYTAKILKDTTTFRDNISIMLTSGAGFATAFTTLFQPINDEVSLTVKHPESATTLRNISSYQELMAELRDTIQPELELIDSRVIAPLKEYQDLLKKIRKTVTKREHKLVDYDRFNNSYKKLSEKKEKSLSDEKNLFKLEQDLEQATQEYEHYNGMLKSDIPHFLRLTTAFISPIFQTFYFIKIGILWSFTDTMLDKMQAWGSQHYGDMSIQGIESMHYERLGDAVERLDALTITKRYMGSAEDVCRRTARMLQQHREASGSDTASTYSRTSRTGSVATSSYASKPPARAGSYGTTSAAAEDPAPPYSAGGGASSVVAGKRAAPPPPAPKRPGGPAVTYVTALYDYAATAEGDLSFNAGDRIELVTKTASTEDWWTGKINGQQGVFPG
ncbi:BQ2448_3006 [Microbotryum intermedium]|uniref:BQ2448_3006 protein n=1 Tax=Microbotryum intermedium TaxID=269621 RepID=A0A238FJR9_9BASI|nr:BQ2448_3006 [Microbotryum intermedium]